MFRAVSFRNFKALENYSLALRKTNILVGPNNAGKSTVLDAFRTLAPALRYARRYRPAPVIGPGQARQLGYNIPSSAVPISTANIHSQYHDVETTVAFTLQNGHTLTLLFDEVSSCRLLLDAPIGTLTTTKQFIRTYPADVSVVPTLGPFEEEETLLTDDYVLQWGASRRGHRLFRNVWHRKDHDDFAEFRDLVERTWPGMSIQKPEIVGYAPARLVMFCKERRIDREIYWSGFGFQIWLQFLTHLISTDLASTLVIDEPDIYLHPDLQRRLFTLVHMRTGQSVMATHSVEIINEAEPEDVLVVDKTRRRAKRVTDIAGVQEAIESLGSTQNIYLTRLARGRKVLFVEGQDFALLRRFAKRLRLERLTESAAITIILTRCDGYN